MNSNSDDDLFTPLTNNQPPVQTYYRNYESSEESDNDELRDDSTIRKRPRSSSSSSSSITEIDTSTLVDDAPGDEDDGTLRQLEPYEVLQRAIANANELITTTNPDVAKELFNQEIAKALRNVLGKSCASEWKPVGTRYVEMKLDTANPAATFAEISQLPRNVLPVFHRFCLPLFFKACMQEGNTKFGGFKTHTEQGLQDYLSFLFYMIAFTNPKFGTNMGFKERSNNFMFQFAEHKRIMPKVTIFVEPLVRTPDRTNTLNMFVVENVIGMRVWFYVHDPNIDPLNIIDETIVNIRTMKGDCNGFERVSAENPEYKERLNTIEGGAESRAYKAILMEIERVNNRLARMEATMAKNKERYQEMIAQKCNTPTFNLTTISSRWAFYTMIQCRRIECNLCYRSVNGRCDMCTNNNQPTFEHLRDNDDEDELERRYIRISPANHRASAMNMEGAMMAEYNLVEKALNPQRALWPYFDVVTDETDPQWRYCNPFIQSILEIAGVCDEQRDEANYTYMSGGKRFYSFFTNQLIFQMSPDICRDIDHLCTMDFPWIFSAADLMLDVLQESLKNTMMIRQAEHTKDHCTDIINTQFHRDAITISTAYAADTQNLMLEDYYFKPVPLTNNSFAGVTIAQPEHICSDKGVVVIESSDASTEYHLLMRKRLIRLDGIKGTISKTLFNMVNEQIRAEGFICLGNIFHSSNPALTTVERNAAKLIEDSAEMGALNSFHEILTIDPHMGAYGSMLVSMMYYFDSCVNRIYDGHIIALQMYFCMMRATHSHDLEQLIKAPTAIQNILNQGTESAGKTERMQEVADITVPGMAQPITSQSERAQSIASNFSGTTMIYDELDDSTCPIKASQRGKMNSIAAAKQEATNFYIVHATLSLADGKFSADGFGTRRQTKYISRAHRARIILANDFYYLLSEGSYWSRFTIYFSLSRQKRLQPRVASGNQLKSTPSTIKNVSPSGLSNRQNWYRLSSAIHVYAAMAMKMGVIPYPNMQMLGIYYNALASHMSVYFPNFTGNSRMVGHVYAQCISKLITFAIHMAFTSEISPLLYHEENGSIIPLPFTYDKIKWISPWLFLSEDAVIFELTHMVLYNQLRSHEYMVALQLATLFCNYTDENDETANFATRPGPGNIRLVDRNYVCTKVPYGQIARHMISNHGFNGATLNENINSLSRLLFKASYIDTVDGVTISEKIIPVIEFINPPNSEQIKPNTGALSPDLINPGAMLLISTAYLRDWCPEKVVKYMMKAFEHSNTRPRKVLIGDTMPGYPELLATYQLKRNPARVFIPKEVSCANERILDTITPANSIMHKTQELSLSRSSTIPNIQYNGDIERTLCIKWLKDENVYIPERIKEVFEYKMYVPEDYNKMILSRRLNNPVYSSTEKTMCYPDSQLGIPLSQLKQYMDNRHFIDLVKSRPASLSKDPNAQPNLEAENTERLLTEGRAIRALNNISKSTVGHISAASSQF